MADGSRSRVQSVIATIAAFCTVIGVIYSLWTSYWRPTAELRATVEYGTYLVDPWTAASMAANSKKIQAIGTELNNYRIAGGKLPASLEKYADDTFNASSYDPSKIDSSQSYGYIRTTISDEGDLGAKDVALRVPNAIGSLVTFDDGSKKIFGRSPTIDLGNLKPEEKVIVYSWMFSPPMFFLSTDNNIGLTYAGGKGSIEVPGKHNMAYQVLMNPIMWIWYAVFGVWLFLWVWRLGFKQGTKEIKSEPDSVAANCEAEHSE